MTPRSGTRPRALEGLEQTLTTLMDAGDYARAATLAIEALGPHVVGYLVAVLRDREEAAEVFSVFCEDFWRGLPAFRRECSIEGWAYRLAWHAAARALRDPYRRRGRRLETTELSALADRVCTSTLSHERDANQDRLARVRAELAPDDQTLLILRVDRKLSWRDVAHVLAAEGAGPVDAAVLRKRFERLKEKLRHELRSAS